jgi:hypothetical protein
MGNFLNDEGVLYQNASLIFLGIEHFDHTTSQPRFVIEEVPDFKSLILKRLGVHSGHAPEDPPCWFVAQKFSLGGQRRFGFGARDSLR